ncbi:signal recognition particle receptor subunit alpha-like [Tubulanus polymorphus]|uniref:signal recognition particle receptor subunit alpha-like n=1 Tax=Tubulanus polymorphus TaxID=672921 RepID=UPI003DA31B2C
MLDLFTIFSKGGIVLWCFQGTSQLFTPSVNALIKSVILQERGGNNTFSHDALTLKYKLDNEFELVFVVAYQKILQLSYIDKFLDDIQLEFRDRYKDDLHRQNISRNFDDFGDVFHEYLRMSEEASRVQAKKPKEMKTFEQSKKSKKTVASMIENKKDEPTNNKKKGKKDKQAKNVTIAEEEMKILKDTTNMETDEEAMARKRLEFMNKHSKKKSPKNGASKEPTKKIRVKESRKWEHGGTGKDAVTLDFSGEQQQNGNEEDVELSSDVLAWKGQMKGNLKDLEAESSEEENDDDDDDESEDEEDHVIPRNKTNSQQSKKGGFGVFNMFKGLVGAKKLTEQDIATTLEKMKDHLISKNVASNIADKLCQSVSTKLQGKVLGTFSSVASTVKQTVEESCVQILAPRRRIDILRDALDAKQNKRPFTVVFCGVNGVGKSTNLAKIAFWLVENGLRVLIAACDTFRAGAVEQLRTHTRKLNALHPPEEFNGVKMVQLYEKGYGKDAAGIAMEAINHARDCHLDVVLIDTAGRMQDNEPLMRALAKLMKVNLPDLVLFVGEALVGNDSVDQLVKFNQALADHSNMENPRLIDGIVLTKFDTIDDKVGAAISMTYTTGQPIVFVGTGQTYTDLKNLNAKAVVNALLK